ncbi:MAG: S41 family peptidase, partial [Oscillospiraceae bacterium]|nr:S41 family peptidase [Oscillospiraceae bacterium]
PGFEQRDTNSSKLQEIDSYIRNNFFGDINELDISNGIFSGYISGLDDKHAMYLTPELHRRQISEDSGQLITAGVRAEREASGYLSVTGVFGGSAAEAAGIVRGDIITDVNTSNVLEVGAAAALQLLEGEENTSVTLTIRRSGESYAFPLVRRALDIVSVDADVVNEIGFVRITAFNALTASQFNAALRTFEGAQVQALIIDLRDNTSGYYAPVTPMSNALVSAETVAQAEHRGGMIRDFVTTDSSLMFPEHMSEIPIIVLVNSRTSGAGELFASILRIHTGTQIVGMPTAGNAYVQQTHTLKDLSAIRVTVARISMTGGPSFAESGLTPDYEVELDSSVSYNISELRDRELHEIADDQIRRAFEIIHSRTANQP